jgi:hypothetical protein
LITSILVIISGTALASCGGTGALPTVTPKTSVHFSAVARSSGPLVAPKVSASDEAGYLRDVTVADSALASYVSSRGDIALQSLLTDGSAFCAFLARGGGIDGAMVSLAIGAKSVEKTTHLPSTVTTFNVIESVALLKLCPSEQALIPVAVREKIATLGEALSSGSG